MSKSTLRPPSIADNSTRTAINELYKQVNKLLTSISPNAQDYAEDALEGSVRAIYNGNNTFRIEGYTSKGWVAVAAQKQAGPNAYKDMPIISDNGHLTISKLTINNLSEISSDTDKFLMSDSGVVKFVTGANLLSYIGGQSVLTFGISDTNAVKIDSSTVADNEYARFTANGLESRSNAEVRSDIGAGTSNVAALNDLSDVTYSSGDLTISSLDKIISGNLDFDSSGHIKFDGCAAGFNRITYEDATNVTVDFKTGNKAHLDMTGGSISGTLTLQFPAVSGNFVLVVQQDGSTRTIANYATKDAAGNAGNNDGGTAGAIRWSGGSVPDLTDGGNKRDILSFYWDADEEVCYGVASLNF